MNHRTAQRSRRRFCAGLVGVVGLAGLGGCAGLLPAAPPAPALYRLDVAAEPATGAAIAASATPAATRPGPTLIVNPPRAAAGYESARMLYLRQPHQLEAYVQSEWVESPARLLGPVIVAALQRSQRYAAVVAAPSSAVGDWRLDLELLHLQQDFTVVPSRLRLGLRATLVDSTTRRVLAWQVFEHSVAAPSDNAQGGVIAAHAALREMLASLRLFIDEAANGWPPARP